MKKLIVISVIFFIVAGVVYLFYLRADQPVQNIMSKRRNFISETAKWDGRAWIECNKIRDSSDLYFCKIYNRDGFPFYRGIFNLNRALKSSNIQIEKYNGYSILLANGDSLSPLESKGKGDFYNRVLSYFGGNTSDFLVVDIKHRGKKRKALVSNEVLYRYYRENFNIGVNDYAVMMWDILNKGKCIELNRKIPEYFDFKVIYKNKKVDEIAFKGKEYFTKYYIDAGELRNVSTEKELNYVIKVLFDFGIETRPVNYYSGSSVEAGRLIMSLD